MKKPILVFYIELGNLGTVDEKEHMQKISEEIRRMSDVENILSLIVPVRNRPDLKPIECLNPQLISDVEYEDIVSIQSKFDKLLESF